MHQSKLVPSLIACVVVIGALCGPAYGKRRRPAKPVDATPATEVDSDAPAHSAAATPAAATASSPPEPSSEAAPEKPVASAPPPEAASPHAVGAGGDPPEVDARRGLATGERDMAGPRLSGHVGVGSPLVTLRASGSSRHVGSVNEDLTLVAPIGLGLALSDHWTFDFEFQVSTGVRPEGITTAIVDPGVLHAWDQITLGVRVAWQLNANQNIGLIPLMRIALLGNQRANWFVEAALPTFVRNKQVTASASLQTGVAF